MHSLIRISFFHAFYKTFIITSTLHRFTSTNLSSSKIQQTNFSFIFSSSFCHNLCLFPLTSPLLCLPTPSLTFHYLFSPLPSFHFPHLPLPLFSSPFLPIPSPSFTSSLLFLPSPSLTSPQLYSPFLPLPFRYIFLVSRDNCSWCRFCCWFSSR